MFIWLFHRISGVSLIILFGIKILTSFFLFTKKTKPDWAPNPQTPLEGKFSLQFCVAAALVKREVNRATFSVPIGDG